MKVFRDIFRKKGRAFLTIFGIAIGIFAVVVMGSMSEKLTLLVNGGIDYYSTRISVLDGESQGLFTMPTPMSTTKIPDILKVEGVRSAYPTVGILKDSEVSMSLGTPPMISGTDLAAAKDETFKIYFSSGRDIQEGDRGVAVLGIDLAKSAKKKVGDTISLRGRDFKVIGIMEKTFTAPDNSAAVALADAQELYYEDIPVAFRSNVNKYELANSINVFVKEGFDPAKVTEAINAQVADVKAYAPDEFKKQIEDSMAIFNVIIMGSALVAVLVGGFSIINTMSMAIIERTREIGIKKAIGASNKRVIREVVQESALMGVLGGAVGTALGYLTVRLINAATESSGQIVFLATTRLLVGSIIFAVIIGAVAGLYPAWYAARLDPIKALRSE